MENNQFDEIDEKILQMLAKDGSIPFQEVARACGVSGTTIHTRVKRLTSLGVIQGSKYIINPAKIERFPPLECPMIRSGNLYFSPIMRRYSTALSCDGSRSQ